MTTRARSLIELVIGAFALNAIMWPILVALIYIATGMDESPIFRADAEISKVLMNLLMVAFLVSCFAVVWVQLTREARISKNQSQEAQQEPGTVAGKPRSSG